MDYFKNKEDYGDQYGQHLLDQYKLFVEMTDRISARRMLANSFFLGINTALISLFAVFLKNNTEEDIRLVWLIPLLALIILCYVWWRIINSYRQLNSGKFKVIHSIEERLPAALYDFEWEILGRGKNPKIYKPLTSIEDLVPICFAFLYIFMGLYFLFN